MAHYEFWYADALGNRISNIPNVSSFSYVMVAGDVGVLSLNTPLSGLPHESNIPDRRINIYRQAVGGSLVLELVAFLDSFSFRTSSNGLEQLDIGGSDLNHLLKRRIVAYNSGSAFAQTNSAFVSNAMRATVARNMGSLTSAERDISGSGYSEANSISQGPAIKKQFAWRNLLTLLQDEQSFSKQQGDEIFFAVVPTSENTMQFQAYAGHIGSDRTITGSNKPVIFSLERGNLLSPSLSYDYSDEANYIYAGGQGIGTDRIIQEAENTDSTGISPFSRKEKFLNATNHDSEDSVLDAAQDRLEKSRPKVNLSGTLISTPTTEYGKDWFFGDRVTVDYRIQADTVIRAVSVSVNGNGDETARARIEIDV